MPITRVSPGVVSVEPEPMSLSQRTYLPQVLSGMFVTLRHLVKNLLNYKNLPII